MTSIPQPDAEQLEKMPAQEAVTWLAARAVEALGTGTFDFDKREYDGELETPVLVTETGVFGPEPAVTTMSGPDVTISIDDDLPPLLQLRALIDQLEAYCVQRDLRRGVR